MSEEKLKWPTIPFESVVKIEVSGGMYARIMQLTQELAQEKGPEEFAKILEHLKNGKERTRFEYHLVTVMALIKEIEEKAEEQKVTVMVDAKDIKFSI